MRDRISKRDLSLLQKLFRDCERPFLDDKDETDLALLVYECAAKHFIESSRTRGDDDDGDPMSFDEKVDRAASDVRTVLDAFEGTNAAKRAFVENLSVVRKSRLETVERLRDIADSIQQDKHNGNVARIAGGCTSAASAVVMIFAVSAAPAAAVVGGVGTALGGLTVLLSDGVEIAQLTGNMKSAKELVDADRTAFAAIEPLFSRAGSLTRAVDDVVGFDVMTEILGDVNKFLVDVKGLKEKVEYNAKFRNLVDASVKRMRADGTIEANFGVDLAPVVATFVFVVCFMCPRNRFVFECLAAVHHLGLGLLGVLGAGAGIGRLVAGLVLGTGAARALPRAAAGAWAVRALAGVGLAIDVVNVAVAAVDVSRGSPSEHADAVRRVALELEQEMKFLEDVSEGIAATVPKSGELPEGARNALQRFCRKLNFFRFSAKYRMQEKENKNYEIVSRKFAEKYTHTKYLPKNTLIPKKRQVAIGR